MATTVTPGVMCIFTMQKSRTPNHERIQLDEMAHALLRTARSQGLMTARIGISAPHAHPTELLRATLVVPPLAEVLRRQKIGEIRRRCGSLDPADCTQELAVVAESRRQHPFHHAL